jgi:hypothetical protein
MASVAQTDKRGEKLAGSLDVMVTVLEQRLAEINRTMALLAGQMAQADERRSMIERLIESVKGDD